MVKLEIMNEDEYNAYINLSMEEHINELVEEENLSLEEAKEAAQNDLQDMLPEGLYTDSNYIMKIVDDSMKQTVGFIWTLHEFHEGKRQSFICELGIYDQYRRNGYATAALEAIEDFARKNQCEQSVLFVKNSNAPAIMLYKKNGYEKTKDFNYGFYMIKNL